MIDWLPVVLGVSAPPPVAFLGGFAIGFLSYALP